MFEQRVTLRLDDREVKVRRIVLRLTAATRDGDTEMAILTNLPASVKAVTIAGLYRRGDVDGALAHYGRAYALVPEMTLTTVGLGAALEAAHRSEDAVRVFQRVLQEDPQNARAQNAMCVSLVSLGRLNEASACLERAIAADPWAPVPYLNLASLLRAPGALRPQRAGAEGR